MPRCYFICGVITIKKYEDILVDLDVNAYRFTLEKELFWKGQNDQHKLGCIYAVGKGLNADNLFILYKTALKLEEKQRREIESNGKDTLEEV